MKRGLKTRIEAIEFYLKGSTLKETASKFNIHPVTLCRWMRWYNEKEKVFYKKPWNRPTREIEEKVMLLKEHMPSRTVREAKKILEKEGINISIKGIYDIWQRYNLVKRPIDDPFSPFGSLTSEVKWTIEYVRELLKNSKDIVTLREAARIINRLPSYPRDHEDILKELPERLLSPRRRLERLYPTFLKIPMPGYLKKIRRIRKVLEREGYLYSSIVAGVSEILALHWMRTPEVELELNTILRKRKGNLRDPVLNFELTFLAGTAYSELLQIEKAYKCVTKCRRLLRFLPHSEFYILLGDLMTFISDYKESLKFYQKALEKNPDESTRKRLFIKMVLSLVISGEYRKTLEILHKLPKVKPDDDEYETFILVQAFLSYGLGKLERGIYWVRKALEESKKEQYRNYIYSASFCLAAIARALGREKESKRILKEYIPLMKKYKLERETSILKFILRKQIIEKSLIKLPIFSLLYLLDKVVKTHKEQYYKKSLDIARRKGLLGFLHRIILFFSEPVSRLLKKGKDTGLPKGILQFPVFNSETPAYHLKFLGDMIVYKNQKYLNVRLSPKETALLIHLAQRIGEPGRSVSINELYKNFWTKSKNPSNRLSHLLIQVKRKIMLPRHLIAISSYTGEKRLINRGFYMTTDYNDFKTNLAEAKALERADQWDSAQKKYLQAFRLIRSAPFRKMYDNWSEDLRGVILNQLENETINITKSCFVHKNKISPKFLTDVKKMFKKISKISPYSDEIKKLSDNL